MSGGSYSYYCTTVHFSFLLGCVSHVLMSLSNQAITAATDLNSSKLWSLSIWPLLPCDLKVPFVQVTRNHVTISSPLPLSHTQTIADTKNQLWPVCKYPPPIQKENGAYPQEIHYNDPHISWPAAYFVLSCLYFIHCSICSCSPALGFVICDFGLSYKHRRCENWANDDRSTEVSLLSCSPSGPFYSSLPKRGSSDSAGRGWK